MARGSAGESVLHKHLRILESFDAWHPFLTLTEIAGQPAIEVLFDAYEAGLREASFLAMGRQIVDAAVVTAPKRRDTEAEESDLKAGRLPDAWKAQPAKLAHKDRDAR